MNKTYRLIWSKAKKALIVVSEIVTGKGGPSKVKTAAAVITIILLLTAGGAYALPKDGQVAAGQVTISTPTATQMNIKQGTNQAIINWNSFGIGKGEAVNIAQPTSQSTLLNRVIGNNPSYIFGALNANGRVFLVNPGGVLFAPGASVNVGGLVASSLNIKDSDFLAGKYSFYKDGVAGSVVNQGNISGGFVALLGSSVENAGNIVTSKGTTGLTAGDEITLGFDPNGLMAIKVDKAAYQAQVANSGVIEADGGTVVMTASAADALLSTVVNNSGIVRARSMVERNGEIVIEGGASGVVENSGTLDVSSANGQAGRIVVAGENVLIKSGAHLRASGATGGGEVLVGGSWQGGDDSIRQATSSVVEQGALLEASATDTGNGGTVVLWSDVKNPLSVTRAYGKFEARGGANSGDGGRIETSGYQVMIGDAIAVDTFAQNGKRGQWLIDPYDISIAASGGNITGTTIGNALNSSNVTIDTTYSTYGTGSNASGTGYSATPSSGNGDITVGDSITKASGGEATLTLKATRHIVLGSGAAISNNSNDGGLNLQLWADLGNLGGIIQVASPSIITKGGWLKFGDSSSAKGGDVFFNGTDAQNISTAGGNINMYGETIIGNTSGILFNTGGGNITFGGLLNSGNRYEFVEGVSGAGTWDLARTAAQSGTHGSAVGDSYLVTITSRLENAMAGLAATYKGAWIGAYRPDYNTGAWVWADGPEAGKQFFLQGDTHKDTNSSGGSMNGSVATGYFANFGSGEPNGGYSSAGETVGQFFGTAGQWNDLIASTTYKAQTAKGTYDVLGYVKETNLAASPLTINVGTGTVTFAGAVGGSKALKSLNVTSTNASGIAINGGAVNTEGDQVFLGNTQLGANTTVASSSGGIGFRGAVDGAKDLTANLGSSGRLVFNDTVGGTTPLASITVGALGQTYINADITTTGSQNYNNAVLFGSVGPPQFVNGDFETDAVGSSTITGWNIYNSPVSLGVDAIGGFTSPVDLTYPAHTQTSCNLATGVGCDAKPSGTYTTLINQDSDPLNTTKSVVMNSSVTCASGYCIVRGPLVVSTGTVSLIPGDAVSFQWKAAGGSDAYDVYGYLLNTSSGSSVPLLNQTGASASVTQPWNTATTTIGSSTPAGDYKFVFVSGSWDATGGKALGAQLFIDSVATVSAGSSTLFGNTACTDCTAKGSSVNFTGGVSLASAATTIDNTSASAMSGVVSGAGSLTKAGSGTLTLSGANTYTGGTTISAGTLSVGTIGNGGVAGNLGAATNAAANLVLGGGTLQYTGLTASTDRNFNLIAGTNSAIDVTTNNLTLAGASTDTTGALTKTGAGTLTLSGANTYTGTTTVSAGTLTVGNNSALGTNTTTVSSGGALNLSGYTFSNALSLAGTGVSGSGALYSNTAATASGNITLDDATTIINNGALTLGGTINGSQALTIGGTGAITLNGIVGGTTALTGLTIGSPASRKSTSLGASITATGDISFNGDITLGQDLTIQSGVINTYNTYTDFTVPTGVTSLTATLVGGAGGKGGNDGSNTGGGTGAVGSLTASFSVAALQHLYFAPGAGGNAGGNSVTNAGGASGGTNTFNLAGGGEGGDTGPTGTSGGGGGGGAATILSLSASPTLSSQLLMAGGGGAGGGSGNNTACPGVCYGQSGANYLSEGIFAGQAGYNSGNQASPIADGGASGGGGGGLRGGVSNPSVFYVNEWTGRGGNSGSSGAANSFSTTSLSTSTMSRSNGASGYATISYGGGTISIAGTVNGSKNLTINSPSVSMSGAAGGSTALASLNVTGSTGITLGGGSVTTFGAQAYNGPVTLNANDTTLTTTGNGSVTLGADVIKGTGAGNLIVNSGSGAVSANGQMGTNASAIGALAITSTGSTTFAGKVYAGSVAKSGTGATYINGGLVQTSGAQIYSDVVDLGGATELSSTSSGDVTINGKISNSTQNALTITASGGGVALNGNLSIGTNAYSPTPIGDISITATGGSVSLGSSVSPISVYAKSLEVTAGSVNAYGSTTSFTCNGSSVSGICLTGSTNLNLASASSFNGVLSGPTSLTKLGLGTLTLSGANTYTGTTTVSAGTLALTVNNALGTTAGSTTVASGATLDLKNVSYATAEGLTLNGGTLKTSTGTSSFAGAITLSANSAIEVNGTQLTLAGVVNAAGFQTTLTGSGTNLLNNASNNFATVLMSNAGTVSLVDTNALVLGASTISGNLTVQTGGSLTQTGALAVTGTTGITSGANNITLDNASNNFGGAVTVVSGKNISILDSNAMSLGAVASTGTVDFATLAGNLTLSGNIATNDTSVNAIKLNAGKNSAAGTSAGGDITVSGGAVSTGTDGIVTLYSGSVTGSAGLTALVGSGSNHFRYNSDETDSHFSTLLASGKNAIYREQPVLSVTPSNQTITYGDATPSFTASYGGYVNGDTSGGTLTGTAIWTVAGSKSTALNYIAGSHDVSYANGLVSSLGYGFADKTASSNELTITKADLTVTGLTANGKIYNANTTATLGGTAAVTALGDDVVTLGGIASGTFATKTVGEGKAVTVTGKTLTGSNDDGNYNLIQQTGLTANITKAQLTTTGAVAQNKVYDATTAATINGETLSGILLTDSVNVSGNGTFADKNAGNAKAVTAALILGSTDAGNYTLTQPTGLTANITKAPLTITAVTNTKVYDAFVTAAAIPTVSGIQGSTDSVTGLFEIYADKNATTGKTLNVSAYNVNDNNSGNNYSVSTVANNTGVVTKAPLTITAVTNTKVYDAFVTAAAIPTVYGIQGSTDTVTGLAEVYADKYVATGKALSVSAYIVNDDNSGNNYLVTLAGNDNSSITRRPVTVTADAKEKYVGQVDPAFTYQSETVLTGRGLLSGETLFGDLTRVAGEARSTYPIQQGTVDNATNDNYDVAFVSANLTVKSIATPDLIHSTMPMPAPQLITTAPAQPPSLPNFYAVGTSADGSLAMATPPSGASAGGPFASETDAGGTPTGAASASGTVTGGTFAGSTDTGTGTGGISTSGASAGGPFASGTDAGGTPTGEASTNGTVTGGTFADGTGTGGISTSGASSGGTLASSASGTSRSGSSTSTSAPGGKSVTGGFTEAKPLIIAPLAAGTAFSYPIPGNTFSHVNAKAVVTLVARMADGSPLPAWMHFDPANKVVTGTPPKGVAGEFQIKITARDQFGGGAQTSLKITVGG